MRCWVKTAPARRRCPTSSRASTGRTRERSSSSASAHKLNEVKAVADRVTVLRRGRSLATVPAAEATPRSLAALMVGREVEVGRRDEARGATGDAVLEIDELWADGDRGEAAVRNAS